MRLGSYVTQQLYAEAGDVNADGVVIDLQDGGKVRALPMDIFNPLAMVDFDSVEEMREALEKAVADSGEEWQRERGPDSDLAKDMEAGTPTTDHSSEPQ